MITVCTASGSMFHSNRREKQLPYAIKLIRYFQLNCLVRIMVENVLPPSNFNSIKIFRMMKIYFWIFQNKTYREKKKTNKADIFMKPKFWRLREKGCKSSQPQPEASWRRVWGAPAGSPVQFAVPLLPEALDSVRCSVESASHCALCVSVLPCQCHAYLDSFVCRKKK